MGPRLRWWCRTSRGFLAVVLVAAAVLVGRPEAPLPAGTAPVATIATEIRAEDCGEPGEATVVSAVDRKASSPLAAAPSAPRVEVAVHVHNFHQRARGRLPTNAARDQVAHLDGAFAGGQAGAATRFRFRLRAYENIPVKNARIDVRTARADRLLRREHVGGRATLNVYLADRLTLGRPDLVILGLAAPPWRVDDEPELDGVWLRRDVLPGVRGGPAGRHGDVAVHEVGHWLGLYHVFQGYCCGRGDQVADTGRMSESSAARRSCRPRDTCRRDRGLTDPVPNFMAYGRDACVDRFTPSQATRMSVQWDRHRA